MDSPRDHESRTARREFLMRKRKGAALRDQLSGLLTEITAEPWTLFSLDDSDELRLRVLSAARSARDSGSIEAHRNLDYAGLSYHTQHAISSKFHEPHAFVTLTDANLIGILKVSVDDLRNILDRLLEFDRDSLIVTNTSVTVGLIIQRFENGESISYQVECWQHVYT